MRDEAIIELAATKPSREDQLSRLRNFPAKFRWRGGASALLRAIDRGKNCPKDKLPEVSVSKKSSLNNEVLALLKVLLSAKSKEFGVSQALIASNAELEKILCRKRTVQIAKWMAMVCFRQRCLGASRRVDGLGNR